MPNAAARIRPAEPGDVAAVHEMICELAEYEKLTHLVVSDEAALQQAMDQSQQVMGTIAMYRHKLQNVEASPAYPMRQAA